jgi:hypothetical protein
VIIYHFPPCEERRKSGKVAKGEGATTAVLNQKENKAKIHASEK